MGVRGDFTTMERGEGLAIIFMYEVKGGKKKTFLPSFKLTFFTSVECVNENVFHMPQKTYERKLRTKMLFALRF